MYTVTFQYAGTFVCSDIKDFLCGNFGEMSGMQVYEDWKHSPYIAAIICEYGIVDRVVNDKRSQRFVETFMSHYLGVKK